MTKAVLRPNQLSIEEVTDIQDRIIASSGAVGAQKHPIKVQDKEYALKSVGDDTLVATSSVSDLIPRLQESVSFGTLSSQVQPPDGEFLLMSTGGCYHHRGLVGVPGARHPDGI